MTVSDSTGSSSSTEAQLGSLRPRGSNTSWPKDHTPTLPSTSVNPSLKHSAPAPTDKLPSPHFYGNNERNKPRALFHELLSLRWMIDPYSSLKLLSTLVVAWAVAQLGCSWAGVHNPLSHLLFISYRLPNETVLENEPELAASVASGALSLDSPELVRYGKGLLDLVFMGFYIVAFSLLRQGLMLWVFKPLFEPYVRGNSKKLTRILEQCYAIFYWGTFGVFGLYVMSFQDSWWYRYEHFWLRYPHWLMRPELKVYYLLQGSYWSQQALVMLCRLEAPRKDYYELVAHHLVTLWLIGWSYGINLTMIGTTVFVAMDIPDTVLGTSKLLNYLDAPGTIQGPFFAMFMVVWSYFRMYLSTRTLISVYNDFWLIPVQHRVFQPSTGAWLAPFMRWQIFAPLFLLLLLNCFWYWLMWRILIRTFRGVYVDERELEEGDDDRLEVPLRDHQEGKA